MRRMKYIRIDDVLTDTIIVFPEHLDHSAVAQSFRGEIVSAGMVSESESDMIRCYGESTSLNLECNPNDTEMLRKQLGYRDPAD